MSKKEAKIEPQQFVFELRYVEAFKLWDSAGAIAEHLAKDYGLKLKSGEPALICLQRDYDIEVKIGINNSSISWFAGKTSLDDFYKMSKGMCDTINSKLGIKEFTRVGARLISLQVHDSLESATQNFFVLGYAQPKNGTYFGIKGRETSIDKSIRWENDDVGVSVKCQVVEQKINFEPPLAIAHYLEPADKTVYGLMYDADYYTKKIVGHSQLNAELWTKQARELIETDRANFMVL